jgi:DNA-binding IclR family transcriptional regulator
MAGTDQDAARVVGADRVLAVLLELGDYPQGVTLDELAQRMRSPKSTVHRALASLRKANLAMQISRGTYVLGDELFRLAFKNFAERPDAVMVAPVLDELASRYGETVHYAVLEGSEVVYRAKTDAPAGAVRLTSAVGGRNPAYRTAVGKLLLSFHVDSEAALRDLIGSGPLERRTPNTVTDVTKLWQELQTTRARGYAIDNQENELGVNCVAVPMGVRSDLSPTGAVSVSALAFRLPLDKLEREAPAIGRIVARSTGAGSQ